MSVECCSISLFENYYTGIIIIPILYLETIFVSNLLQTKRLFERHRLKVAFAIFMALFCGIIIFEVREHYDKITNVIINSHDTLLNNYYGIVAIASSLYVGLISFMYPKIFDIESQIKKKWLDLYEQFFEKKKLRHNYIFIISLFLFLSIFSLFFKHIYIISLNIVAATVAVVYNFIITRKLEEYIFNESYIIKKIILKIDYSKSPENNDNYYYNVINSFQNNIIYLINDDNSNYNEIKQYIEFINKCIFDYLDYLVKNSDNLNKEYYTYPLDKIQYLNQIATQEDADEVSLLLINNIYDNIVKIEERYGNTAIINNIFNILIDKLTSMFTDSIKYKSFNINSLDVLMTLYLKLINKDLIKNNEIQQNSIFFRVVKGLVDSNFSFEYFKDIRDKFENTMYSTKDSNKLHVVRNNIVVLNVSILAYFYYKNRYEFIRDYIGNRFNRHNSIYTLFLDNLNKIVKYTINGNLNIFDSCNIQKFNDNTGEDDEDYKYNILFLCMILIKQTLETHIKDIVYYLKNGENGYLSLVKNITNKLLNIDCIEDFEKSDIYDNILNDMEDIKSKLNKFLQNKKLFDVFEIKINEDGNKYKKFIIQQLARIKKILDGKRNSLLIETIMNYQNNFELEKINIINNDTTNNKFLTFEFDKKKSITNNLEYSILNKLKEESYLYIYHEILNKCEKIKTPEEIHDDNLENYIIIGNFINNKYDSNTFKKYFPDEKQFTKNVSENESINFIKIKEYNVEILNNIEVFYQTPMDNIEHSLILFDKSKINIGKIRNNHIKEKTNFEENENKIIVNMPQPISITFNDDFKGYFMVL
jgi:hypothetical protein